MISEGGGGGGWPVLLWSEWLNCVMQTCHQWSHNSRKCCHGGSVRPPQLARYPINILIYWYCMYNVSLAKFQEYILYLWEPSRKISDQNILVWFFFSTVSNYNTGAKLYQVKQVYWSSHSFSGYSYTLARCYTGCEFWVLNKTVLCVI